MSYNFSYNIPMFFESSPNLWFKVVDVPFDENKSIFRKFPFQTFYFIKLNSNQLDIVGDFTHGSHPRPYSEIKRLHSQLLKSPITKRMSSI